jgi:hypothetical protein
MKIGDASLNGSSGALLESASRTEGPDFIKKAVAHYFRTVENQEVVGDVEVRGEGVVGVRATIRPVPEKNQDTVNRY